jgi:peroxiredoxin
MRQGPAVNSLAPEFSLPATTGSESGRRRVTLDDYRGRWLAMLFYPRDFGLV